MSVCLPSAAVLFGFLGTCVGTLIYELPRFAICTHLLVLHLPLFGVLVMLLAVCVGMLFESRRPQFAIRQLLVLWLPFNWHAIEIPSMCHSPARLPVGSLFLCSPSCSVCPPASFYVLALLSCNIRTGNTQKFVLVKAKVKPQHSEGKKSVQIVPSHGQQRHLSFILHSLNEKAESGGASANSFLHSTLPSEPCGELECPVSRKVSLTLSLLG